MWIKTLKNGQCMVMPDMAVFQGPAAARDYIITKPKLKNHGIKNWKSNSKKALSRIV
jgi:hypothetical protein